MEKKLAKWGFKNQKEQTLTIRDTLERLKENLKENEQRPLVHLGHGDPSPYPSFRTTPVAEQALLSALHSAQFNGYAPGAGLSAARRAVAEYLCEDLPYKLSEEDVFLTAGANHAIEVILTILARPGANILLPRPGYPLYEARAAFSNLEVRHFDLLPERGWEVDLDAVEALADENTIAMVVINPGNPCGNVFTFEHMQKIVETAKRIGILLIADEVYNHLVFGCNKFVPMGSFGSVPVGYRFIGFKSSKEMGRHGFALKLAREESVLVLPGMYGDNLNMQKQVMNNSAAMAYMNAQTPEKLHFFLLIDSFLQNYHYVLK
ncbi:Nicotianamine aminotransferase 1 [Sesamum angolense]|uniref:Nicotianamine aminotransferase 1 n=1 Tax=Sesamum angolense TaxID=2727404 RepID=A0AAE2BUA5_9LAMI|nr:Nicotianamine aminotransferase 1 [Sesamum angolense]